MDGVADAVDKCPNTPLTDLVDINGCTKKILIPKSNKHHYDIIIGANYAGSNFASLNRTDTVSSSLQVDYYYENFSLQASTSYYKTDGDGYSENGLNDSFIGAAYNIKPNKDLLVRIGVGAIVPTYDTGLDNNNMDYTASINLSYTLEKINVFGGYIYTMINDDDTSKTVDGTLYNYNYQNTNGLSFGAGYYFTNKLYMSASYNTADSIYKNVEDVESLSLYGYRSIDKNWFLTFFYAYGLSDSASDHAASIKLGYYF
jgi:long-subunit fatty acid transport protein